MFGLKGGEKVEIKEKPKTYYFPNLRAEMARRGDRLEDVANVLNISVPSLSRRLSNEIAFDVNEIDILCKRYQVPFETLFVKE